MRGAELDRLAPQLFVCELLDLRLQIVDGGNHRPQLLDDALVRGAKYLCQNFIEKHSYLRLPV